MWKQASAGVLLGCTIVGMGFFLGTLAGSTLASPDDYLVAVGKVQGIIAACVAAAAAGVALFGVYLQIAAQERGREVERHATTEALNFLLQQHIGDTLFAIEYQAEYALHVPITSPHAHMATANMNNRLLGSMAAEAVNRFWSEISKTSTAERMTLARLASILDKLGKNCLNTAFAIDLLKGYQPQPGEMSHIGFFVAQRDLLIEILKAEGVYTEAMHQVHKTAKERVEMFLRRMAQA